MPCGPLSVTTDSHRVPPEPRGFEVPRPGLEGRLIPVRPIGSEGGDSSPWSRGTLLPETGPAGTEGPLKLGNEVGKYKDRGVTFSRRTKERRPRHPSLGPGSHVTETCVYYRTHCLLRHESTVDDGRTTGQGPSWAYGGRERPGTVRDAGPRLPSPSPGRPAAPDPRGLWNRGSLPRPQATSRSRPPGDHSPDPCRPDPGGPTQPGSETGTEEGPTEEGCPAGAGATAEPPRPRRRKGPGSKEVRVHGRPGPPSPTPEPSDPPRPPSARRGSPYPRGFGSTEEVEGLRRGRGCEKRTGGGGTNGFEAVPWE